jgi:hypothetical protein
LWRCLELLYSNSVVPRVAAARIALRRRAEAGTYEDPIELGIDVAESAKGLEISLNDIVDDRDQLRRRNPDYKRGEAEMLDAVRSFLYEHRYDTASTDAKSELVDELERMWEALPWEVPRVSGILDHDEIDDLTDTSWWASLMEAEKDEPDIAVPTTLGSLRPHVVRALVLRGYVHGYLGSLAIEPFSSTELDSGSAATHATERIRTLATRPLHVL